jgi:hypothetical protein
LSSTERALALLAALLRNWGPPGAADRTAAEILEHYVGPADSVRLVQPIYNTGMSLDGPFVELSKEGTLRVPGFAPVPLPEEPSWKEDPFRSISWRQRYQSLFWLLGFTSGPQTGDGLEQVERYLRSWLAVNTWPRSVDAYAYDDHAIAMRAEFLAALLTAHPDLSKERPDLAAQATALLALHGLLLDDLLDNPAFVAHNHGLFHARALLCTALALPGAPFAPHWRDRALARLGQLLDLLYHDDGFSVEQAASYQFIVTRVLVRTYLSLYDTQAVPRELLDAMCSAIARALRAAVCLAHPDGSLVRYGDTEDYADARQEVNALAEGELPRACGGSDTRWLWPQGQFCGARIATSSGYAIFQSGPEVASRSYLFVDFTPQVFSHGHYDATSFEYSVDGTKWIVDSGGPYRFDDSCKRHYILSSRAHNVCLPDGREQTDGEAWVVTTQETADYHLLVLGTNVHGADYRHLRRFVVLRDVRAAAVTDFFRRSAGDVALAGRLQFEPDGTITLGDRALITPMRGETKLLVSIWNPSGAPVHTRVARGEGDCGPNMQGWISRQKAVLEPAPMLAYETQDHATAEVTVLLAGDESAQARLRTIVTSLPSLAAAAGD